MNEVINLNLTKHYRMNLIQQFLEENLSRDLNHHLLSQIQDQNSAVESLVSNLEDLRQKENSEIIESKIKRIQAFLDIKKQILNALQSFSTNSKVFFDWVMNNLMNSSFLYELIRREELFVQKQLLEIGKRTLLCENYVQQTHQEIQFGNRLIRQLSLLNQDKSQIGKAINRQRIKEIDNGMQVIEEKIKTLDEKVSNFNTQMLIFLRKIYSFDQKIKNQFYLCFRTESNGQQQLSPSNLPQNDREFRRKNSRSHLSVNSRGDESRQKFAKTRQIFQNQGTPRKLLETQTFEAIQSLKAERNKLSLDKRKSTIYEKNSGFEQKNLAQNDLRSMMENKGSTIEWRRGSEKYPQVLYPESMNKTLNNFNYSRPQSSSMLYATNDSGRQIRLPTKWASNSRSSISNYPLR